MRIGELAARTGMSRDTIRFYEKGGLVAGRRLANGYRDFPPEAVAWLQYVRTARTLGFSLAEIARTGEELRGAPDTAEALSALFEEKIGVIDARMSQLASLRAELTERVGTGCPLRAAGPDGGRGGDGGTEGGGGRVAGRAPVPLIGALKPVD
ncbi:MerR family transcriptional regulator [Streptomyces sp. NPDC007088]|uniref:MerR family transcriptional regulator n=1 Tax=Streptomyces sp. NPDC007088 TaxID=3364773 RepID=UPI00368C0093